MLVKKIYKKIPGNGDRIVKNNITFYNNKYVLFFFTWPLPSYLTNEWTEEYCGIRIL